MGHVGNKPPLLTPALPAENSLLPAHNGENSALPAALCRGFVRAGINSFDQRKGPLHKRQLLVHRCSL